MSVGTTVAGIDLGPDFVEARRALLAHPIYETVSNADHLRVFMKYHVFAVWDFMALLKRLQQLVTCCTVPWTPPRQPALARMVNEIVLGEESDEAGDGTYASHYELYRAAMADLQASVAPIDHCVAAVAAGQDIGAALDSPLIPEAAGQFVRYTLSIAAHGAPHAVAASFFYGREDLIPQMFLRLEPQLRATGHHTERLAYYLRRHIELDGDQHGPLAAKLVAHLSQGRADFQAEVAPIATGSLLARTRLWDGALAEIRNRESDSAR